MAAGMLGGDGFGGEGHNPGAIRRGGIGQGGSQMRVSGPYDRPPRDSRNARWNGGGMGGRLTPPGARPAGGRGRGPSFADGGVGGMSATGPREAVMGRTVKSYEDLDAVGGAAGGGGGGGGLDY